MLLSMANFPPSAELALTSASPDFKLQKLYPKQSSFLFDRTPMPNFSKIDFGRKQGSEELYLRDLFDYIGALNLRMDSFLNFTGNLHPEESDLYLSSFLPDPSLFQGSRPMRSVSFEGFVASTHIEVLSFLSLIFIVYSFNHSIELPSSVFLSEFSPPIL